MNLIQPPKGFDRATGVREGRKSCGNCGKMFPVTYAESHQCPFCHSVQTTDVVPVPRPANEPS